MILRPSNAHRWMSCAMSVWQPPDRPDEESDAAREGTCAAWVAECVLNGDAASAEDLLGRVHNNGWEVDEEMVRHVQWYIDTVKPWDRQVTAEVFRKSDVGLQGTLDAECLDGNVLYLWDLKYGYGLVDVRNNWQLLCYLWLYIMNTGHYPETVQLAICQPRAIHPDGPYRKWVLSRAEYEPLLAQISERIVELQRGNKTAVPGPQCTHCALAVGCDALTQTVYQIMDTVTQSRVYRQPEPQQLADELAVLRSFKTLFDARLAAVDSEAEARLQEGQFVPGWVLQKKYGKKKFTVSDAAIQMITGVDPLETKTCTPAELIRRGATELAVKSITETPFIGVKLARMDPEDVLAQINAVKSKGVGNG